MRFDAMGALAIAMSIIGFVTVWVKLGSKMGGQEKTIEVLEKKVEEGGKEIAKLKSETHGIQIDIARRMGAIETKLDFIRETVAALKGGRRAAEK
jgi:uncharacterized protein YoxC